MKPLVFKGQVKKKTRKKTTIAKQPVQENDAKVWTIPSDLEISGPCILYNQNHVLVSNNGKIGFKKCTDFDDFEPDAGNQVFIATKLSFGFVFKDCFDKYLTADKFGVVLCDSDATGPREQFIMEMVDDGFTLKSFYSTFLSNDDGTCRCDAVTVEKSQIFKIKIHTRTRNEKKLESKPKKKLAVGIETELIGKYHSRGLFDRTRVDESDVLGLENARKQGRLHEELVKRREQLKSDKFCK